MSAALLTFLPLLAAAEGEEEKFTPIVADLNLFLFTWIVFGVVIIVLSKFAWKPLAAKLDERENRIASGLEEAEKAREEARLQRDALVTGVVHHPGVARPLGDVVHRFSVLAGG